MGLGLKLLVDTKTNKVLFAEAEKEFVDFLFHLLSLPVATILRLINVPNRVGSIGDLYTSIESLNSDYLLSNSTKNSILNPKTGINVPLLALTVAPSPNGPNKILYTCPYRHHHYPSATRAPAQKRGKGGSRISGFHNRSQPDTHNYVTDLSGQICPSCNNTLSTVLDYLVPEESVDVASPSNGYVTGVVRYMVMDHLAVKPMSTISGITMMNEFGIKDITSLAEKQVQVTPNEGVAILKASLETRDVLTTVFLGKKI